MKVHILPIFLVLCSGLLVGSFAVADDLFEDNAFDSLLGIEKKISEEEVVPRSKKAVDLTLSCAGKDNSAGLNFILMSPVTLKFEILAANGAKKSFYMKPGPQVWELARSWSEMSAIREKGQVREGGDTYKGWKINFEGLNFTYFVKPNFGCYNNGDVKKFAMDWEKNFPEYEKINFRIDVIPDEKNLQIWINGRLGGTIPGTNKLKHLKISGGAGPEILDAKTYHTDLSSPFLPMRIQDTVYAADTLKKDASLSLKKGFQQIHGIPMHVMPPEHSLQPSRHRRMRGMYELVMDPYTSRTAFDFMAEAMHYSIPRAVYSTAYVLCSPLPGAENDPQNFALRLTLFGGRTRGRGEAISDSWFDLRKPENKDRIRQVGTLTGKKDGKDITAPLYLAEVPLQIGAILDLAVMKHKLYPAMQIGPYLDFELLADPKSTVQIFGITLCRSKIQMIPEPSHPGNIFHNDEKPELPLRLFAAKSNTAGTLEYTIRDANDKEVLTKSIPLQFPKAAVERVLRIPLDVPEVGWYGIKLTLKDADGKTELVHNAAFAVLGRDDREAGYESPFGTWVFGGEHATESDLNVIGELCFKAGFRIITAVGTEQELKKWKLTLNQILTYRRFDVSKPEESTKAFRDYVQGIVARFPNARAIDILHEVGGIGTPREMLGYKPEITNQNAMESKDPNVRMVTMMAKIIREEFPQLKILFGNSCASSELVAWYLSQGLDPKLIDYIGIETPAYGGLPERLNNLKVPATWMAMETARKFGYNWPASGCFEFTYRSERRYNPLDHARHYMRDILLGLGFGFEHVTPGILDDAGAAYYHGNWGGSGFVQRSPLLYPKRAYVAAAALTRALDKAKFLRRFPTGSPGAYALEFKRERKKPDFAYAFWTPADETTLSVVFPSDTKISLIHLFGKTEELRQNASGAVSVNAGPSPCYLIADKQAVSGTVTGYAPPVIPSGKATVLEPLAGSDNPELVRDYAMYGVGGFPSQIPGTFSLGKKQDPAHGNVLSLLLHGRKNLPEIVLEYAVIRFRKPIPIPEDTQTLGLLVKGNSSHGGVLFELTDANGVVWRSGLPDEALLTSDSWQFRGISPTSVAPVVFTGKRPAKPALPMKCSAIYVISAQTALDPVNMVPLSPEILLGPLTAFAGAVSP